MATQYHNISGELTQELLAAGDDASISSISLANVGKVQATKVDLYAERKLTGKFYILKNVSIPVGSTLTHDFSIDNSSGAFGLYIKLTKGDTFTLTGSIDVTVSYTHLTLPTTPYV